MPHAWCQFNFWLSSCEFSEDKGIAFIFLQFSDNFMLFLCWVNICYLNFIKLGERNHFLLMDTVVIVLGETTLYALWVHNHWSSILWIFFNMLLIFKSYMYNLYFCCCKWYHSQSYFGKRGFIWLPYTDYNPYWRKGQQDRNVKAGSWRQA